MKVKKRKLLLVAVAVTGLAIGAAWPPPPLPKFTEGGDNWHIPPATDVARHAPQDMTTVTNTLRWKGDTGSAMGERGTWRLAGIVNEARPSVLVMTSDKAQRIGIGETLPDGSVLLSVQGDHATSKRDTCTTTYQLFQAQAVKKSGLCEEVEVPDQGPNQ